MKTIAKDQITCPEHLEVLQTESHHGHELVIDKSGIIRWKPDDLVCKKMNGLNFNTIVLEMINRGIDKNCEEYRKLYRDIGYSLDGYWELFYWEVNNPLTSRYVPNER